MVSTKKVKNTQANLENLTVSLLNICNLFCGDQTIYGWVLKYIDTESINKKDILSYNTCWKKYLTVSFKNGAQENKTNYWQKL